VSFLLQKGYPKSQSFIESSHKKINMILKVAQPNFYRLTDHLSKQLNETETQIAEHVLSGTSPKKRSAHFLTSDTKIIELLSTCSETNVFEKLQMISKVLRAKESTRMQPFHPVERLQPAVEHPNVERGILPARVRRSHQVIQRQSDIINQLYAEDPTRHNEVDEEEHYPLIDVVDDVIIEEYLDDEGDGYVNEVDQNGITIEYLDAEDDGYVSEVDQNQFPEICNSFDDGAGRSSGYGCDNCARVFPTSRGLNIHKAVHRRQLKTLL
jgi:hypothetical protein